jgi:hypothetical protein
MVVARRDGGNVEKGCNIFPVILTPSRLYALQITSSEILNLTPYF